MHALLSIFSKSIRKFLPRTTGRKTLSKWSDMDKVTARNTFTGKGGKRG
jgi:hypothetical protein